MPYSCPSDVHHAYVYHLLITDLDDDVDGDDDDRPFKFENKKRNEISENEREEPGMTSDGRTRRGETFKNVLQ